MTAPCWHWGCLARGQLVQELSLPSLTRSDSSGSPVAGPQVLYPLLAVLVVGRSHSHAPCFVFQNYTQYIPLSIYDLQTWMGSPSIFVYDCSNAGLIVKSFKQFALQREQELEVSVSPAWAELGLLAWGLAARGTPCPWSGVAGIAQAWLSIQ